MDVLSSSTAKKINPWESFNKQQQNIVVYGGLFCFAAALRFWGLSRFNSLVFDEVYFANNGYNYLHNIPFFDIHPPLGKLILALGIKLAEYLPFDNTIVTTTEHWTLPTWHYRWLNAFVGSFIPLVAAGLVQTLTRRRGYGWITGTLVAFDGLLLVESRYALLNIYLVIFGLLGHLIFFKTLLDSPAHPAPWKRSLGFILSGLFLGATVCVKWNGSGFLLVIYALWFLGMAFYLVRLSRHSLQKTVLFPRFLHRISRLIPNGYQNNENSSQHILFRRIILLRPYHMFLYFGVIPAVLYRLQWIPHLMISPEFNFWEVHRQIWQYNINLGAGQKVHPYCSTWNTWPWLLRPIAYFFKEVKTPEDANQFGLSATNLPRIYDVHATGNALLWWGSTLAVIVLVIILGTPLRTWLQERLLLPPAEQDVLIYLLVAYGANWLPWSRVTRCLYLYHYMPASLFSFFALGWCIHRCIRSSHRVWQGLGWGIFAVVGLGFFYWLPIFIGSSLSPDDFHQRMWLQSWY
jgi:dolichyl-phosphate-mannose--protein O-mannosyl transferase